MLFSFGSETAILTSEDLRDALFTALASLGERAKCWPFRRTSAAIIPAPGN